jgi:hypothetical protein
MPPAARRVRPTHLAAALGVCLWTGGPQPSGAVLHYDMESRTEDGRLRDLSGRGHHGELGRATPVPGRSGSALLFRTVADRIHVPSHSDFDLDGPLTVAVRLRVDSLGLHQHVLACDDKFALWITPDDRFRLGDTRGGGGSTAPGVAVRGRWVDVVAVLRATRGDSLGADAIAIYLDGKPAGAAPHLRTEVARAVGPKWNSGALFPSDACYVGFESHQGHAAHQQLPFVGAIDEVVVASRAWTEAEVVAWSRTDGGP